MEIVSDRSARTLNEGIEKNVERGSVIITDMWRGYNSISLRDFEHFCVNHSYNFLDPMDNSINTQKIESTWSSLKRFLRNKGTNLKPHLSILENICIKGL